MKYPYIIFLRENKYSYIDDYIKENDNKFECSFYITEDFNDINLLNNENYHILYTYGEKYEYSILNYLLYKRFHSLWIHSDNIKDIQDISFFNFKVNSCYIKYAIGNRIQMRPSFSIFTTCYKSYNKILRAYNSLLNQTFHDWEWVIMDDTPDENDNNIHFKFLKKKLIDCRVRLYKRSCNSGSIGNVKNEVIGLCRGKYILELDHDDEITGNCLYDSYNLFESDNEIGFIYMDFINMYEDQTPTKYNSDVLCKGYAGYYKMKYNSKWHNVLITPNINNITLSHLTCCPNHPRIWRTCVLKELGSYCEKLPICDDYEILLRTCINYKVAKICKLGYIQYMNNDNNNFSLIRNSEINRLGPEFIMPIFYDLYNVDQKMTQTNSYEDISYIHNYSNIWLRDDNYNHKYCNIRVNNDFDKQLCIIGYKKLFENSFVYDDKTDIYVIDNYINENEIQSYINMNNMNNIKYSIVKNGNKNQLLNYFNMLLKYTENVTYIY